MQCSIQAFWLAASKLQQIRVAKTILANSYAARIVPIGTAFNISEFEIQQLVKVCSKLHFVKCKLYSETKNIEFMMFCSNKLRCQYSK